jgi:protein-tyrosine phosphatase
MNEIVANLYAGCENEVAYAVKVYKCNVVIDLRKEATYSLVSDYLTSEMERKYCTSNNVQYHYFPCSDGIAFPDNFLPEVVNAMRKEIEAGNRLFVHCAAGVSRTAMVISAYLIAYHGMNPDEAITFACSKRKCFFPHPNLWKSLKSFAENYGHYQISEWNSMFND